MSRNINFITAHQEFELTVTFNDVPFVGFQFSTVTMLNAIRGTRLHVMQSYKAYRFSDIPLAHRLNIISSNT